MAVQERSYRKVLAANGLIYLAENELEIAVKNFSVTGALVILLPNPIIKETKALFAAIKTCISLTDIYLPEMRLAGEVRIVRADSTLEGFLLALEFVQVSYNIDTVFYQRKVYRKSLEAFGLIFLEARKRVFRTINVSVEGLMIHLEGKIEVEPGLTTAFEFERLHLLGEVEIIWIDAAHDGGTLMGLRYIHMERDTVKGIPSFALA